MWTIITKEQTYKNLSTKEKNEAISRLKQNRSTFEVIDPDNYRMYFEPYFEDERN